MRNWTLFGAALILGVVNLAILADSPATKAPATRPAAAVSPPTAPDDRPSLEPILGPGAAVDWDAGLSDYSVQFDARLGMSVLSVPVPPVPVPPPAPVATTRPAPPNASTSRPASTAPSASVKPTPKPVAGPKPFPKVVGRALKLQGKQNLNGSIELFALVRLRTDLSSNSSVSFTVAHNMLSTPPDAAGTQGVKGARTSETGLTFSLRGIGNPGIVYADATRNRAALNDPKVAPPGLGYHPTPSNSFSYHLRAYETYLPGWPESLRTHVESDMAELPGLSQKWLPVRITVSPGHVSFWLDDRLVACRNDPTLNADGTVEINLGPGTQLAGLRIGAPIATPGFLPVRIDGYANGRNLLGSAAVDRQSLPAPDKIATIANVPFLFPSVNLEGHDHIDVSRSLFRQGDVTGYLPTDSVAWGGSMYRDPARTQIRIPNHTYDTLYAVATCDDLADRNPSFTAMFFRPSAGFSENFSARVPLATQATSEATPIPVKLADGRTANLWLVRIALDPGRLSSLSDLDVVEIELCKQPLQYRSYPDPITYGWHPGGLPSAVHLYALTLGLAPVEFAWNPDAFGHVWQSPAAPSYTATLTNHLPVAQTGKLVISTRSWDGSETTSQEQAVTLPPAISDVSDSPQTQPAPAPQRLAFSVPVKLFGYHDITATLTIGGKTWDEKRSLVLLAPDNRAARWTPGQGALFGYWSYHGGHYTPDASEIVRLMTLAGARASLGSSAGLSSEAATLVADHWFNGQAGAWEVRPQPWASQDHPDPAMITDFQTRTVAAVTKAREKLKPAEVPDHVYFYPEPHLSNRLTTGNIPEYWSEKPYEFTPEEQERIKMFVNSTTYAAQALQKAFPGVKMLVPWGDPLFVWPLLRAGLSKDLIDGCGLDSPGFERIPERQLHEQSIHRLYELRREFEKAGIPNPRLQTCEGIFVPTEVGAVSWREQMDIYNRWSLLCMAYGVDRFYSGWFAFDCGSYYGAEHYGGCGIQRRIPYCDPKPAYAAFAAMTDQLNAANFDGWVKTGSLSTYCLRFKNDKGFVYALWTLRGQRPVVLTLSGPGSVIVTDSMNNAKVIPSADGTAMITTDSSVLYVHVNANGKSGEIASMALGAPSHADAAPAPDAKVVADLGDGSWKLTNERDPILENNHYALMHYPGRFSISTALDSYGDAGGNKIPVLVSHLDKQDATHELMPWYNVLRPAAPIVLAGAPARLGLWVRGAGDWGRFVYVLRDAKGKRWTSIGSKDDYNCDDPHSWSQFCFDGWRYLTFELPGHAGYDSFRKYGTTWWRAEKGEDLVELPLTVEAIIIEQRTHILYVNDIQPVPSDSVAYGKLLVEYDQPGDATQEAVRQSRLRMPDPTGLPELPNPIAQMTTDGVGDPVNLLKLRPPEHEADGTRVSVEFTEAAGAQKYFLWVSAHADGRGAVNLTPAGLKQGQLVNGLRPGMALYYWITYLDADKKMSKPSATHEEVLVDMFKEK